MPTRIRKIAVITTTRADYAYLKPVMQLIKKTKAFKLQTVVTGTHFSELFGNSFLEIEKDGFDIDLSVPMKITNDSPAAWPVALGEELQKITLGLKELDPHLVVVLGDRGEPLMAVVAALHLGIGIAHIHGGDISTGGAVDDSIRHAISKIAHLHFPASKGSAKRLIAMGEERHRILEVGETSIDLVRDSDVATQNNTHKFLKTPVCEKSCICIFHPETLNYRDATKQVKTILALLKKNNVQTFMIEPNVDKGNEGIRSYMKKMAKESWLNCYKNIPLPIFYSLYKQVDFIIGNSSSGIIESPYFNCSAINVGIRQQGREGRGNVINCGFNESEMQKAIVKSLANINWRKKIGRLAENLKKEPPASRQIVDALKKVDLNRAFFQKWAK